jgi:hypothetical protein
MRQFSPNLPYDPGQSRNIVDNRIVTRERQNVGDDLHGPTRGPIQLGLACSDLFSTVPQASPQNLIEFG